MKRTISYQPAKFHCCIFPGSSFTEGFVKHNDDIIMTSFTLLGLKFAYVMKLNIGYQPVKFQISEQSGSNFTEVGIRHQKTLFSKYSSRRTTILAVIV